MIKHGKVQPGKTPSVVSGLPSTKIVDAEPVRPGEKPADPGLRKLAATLGCQPEKEKRDE